MLKGVDEMRWIIRDMDGGIVEVVNSRREAKDRAMDITGSRRAVESKGNCFYYFKRGGREIYVIREDCLERYWGEA